VDTIGTDPVVLVQATDVAVLLFCELEVEHIDVFLLVTEGA